MSRELARAGAAAVEYNAPMSSARAGLLVESLTAHAGDVLDLGCGEGALALAIAAADDTRVVRGVDIDPAAIDRCRDRAVERGLADRARFDVADGADITDGADHVVCIGASHIFGSEQAALAALFPLTRRSAIVGLGIWASSPTAELEAVFGELPRGLGSAVAMAEAVGWAVDEADVSTLDEWDHFEQSWTDAVERVGTTEARSFAAERREEYQAYRGVLDFAWLHLRRP